MTDWAFEIVATYGIWVVAASAYVSCLAVPIPTALIMLAAGAFAAAGDLVLWQVLVAGWAAALAGDNTGYQIGRWGGPPLLRWVADHTGRQALIARGERLVQEKGGVGVFLSTWLIAPLGPWVNLIAGAMGLPRWRFAIWDTLGETIWVCGYVLLGYGFGSQIDSVAQIISDWGGLLASLTVATGFGVALLLKMMRKRRNQSPLAQHSP